MLGHSFRNGLTIALIFLMLVTDSRTAWASASRCEPAVLRVLGTTAAAPVETPFTTRLRESLQRECRGQTCSRDGIIRSLRESLPSWQAIHGRSKAYYALLAVVIGTSAVISGLAIYVGPNYPQLAILIAVFLSPLAAKAVVIAGAPVWEPLFAMFRNRAFGVGQRQEELAEGRRLEDQYQRTNQTLPLTSQASRDIIETYIRRLVSHTDKIRKSIEGATRKGELSENKEYLHSVARMAEIFLRLHRLFPDINPTIEIIRTSVNVSFELVEPAIRRRFLQDVLERVMQDLKRIETEHAINRKDVREVLSSWLGLRTLEPVEAPARAREVLSQWRSEDAGSNPTAAAVTVTRREQQAVIDRSTWLPIWRPWRDSLTSESAPQGLRLVEVTPQPSKPRTQRIVTSVDHYTPVRFSHQGREVIAEMRVREELLQHKRSGSIIERAPELVVFEIKMENPSVSGSVLRSSLQLPKELLERFLSGSLNASEQSQVLALPVRRSSSVEAAEILLRNMQELLSSLHSERPQHFEQPVVTIRFQRRTYELTATEGEAVGATFRLVIDRGLQHLERRAGQNRIEEVALYDQNWRVVRIEEPLATEYRPASSSAAALREVQTLAEQLRAQRVESFPVDLGKFETLFLER